MTESPLGATLNLLSCPMTLSVESSSVVTIPGRFLPLGHCGPPDLQFRKIVRYAVAMACDRFMPWSVGSALCR
jgi:hypothetical protein